MINMFIHDSFGTVWEHHAMDDVGDREPTERQRRHYYIIIIPERPPPPNNGPDSRNQQQFLSQTSSCSEGTRQNGSARTTKQGRDPFPHHNNNGLTSASLSEGSVEMPKSARPGGGYFIIRTLKHRGCARPCFNTNRGPLPALHGQVLTVEPGGETVR